MKRRNVNPCSWATTLYSSQPFTEAKATEFVLPVRVALQRLLDAAADEYQFMRLGVAVNLAAVRAEQIPGSGEAIEILNAAGEALTEARRINDAHGRYGLTGPGRQHLMAGIDAYEAILRASSPRQMHLAEVELGRRLSHLQKGAV